jgi:hypothetical protein
MPPCPVCHNAWSMSLWGRDVSIPGVEPNTLDRFMYVCWICESKYTEEEVTRNDHASE